MERRAATGLQAAGSRLTGYAAVWDAPAKLSGFTEYVRKGAFRRSLERGDDVLAMVDHSPTLILGRRSAGTLVVQEDDRGLAFTVELPDTTAGRDVRVSVERGDMRGASFGFKVNGKAGERWTADGGSPVRELLDLDLFDVTVTGIPAYPDTSVALRSMPAPGAVRLVTARRYLEMIGAR